MAKMWSSNEEFDFEIARDYASKLVLIGSAQRAGIFEALSEEKDIAALNYMLNADERALFITLEALATLGYIHKNRACISYLRKHALFSLNAVMIMLEGLFPTFSRLRKAWLKLPEIIKGAKPDREERDVGCSMNAMASRPDKVVEEAVNYCLKKKEKCKKCS